MHDCFFFFKLIFSHLRPRRLFSRKFVTTIHFWAFWHDINIMEVLMEKCDEQNGKKNILWWTKIAKAEEKSEKRRKKWNSEECALSRFDSSNVISFFIFTGCCLGRRLFFGLLRTTLLYSCYSDGKTLKRSPVVLRNAEWIWNKQKYISSRTRITLISDGENIVFCALRQFKSGSLRHEIEKQHSDGCIKALNRAKLCVWFDLTRKISLGVGGDFGGGGNPEKKNHFITSQIDFSQIFFASDAPLHFEHCS